MPPPRSTPSNTQRKSQFEALKEQRRTQGRPPQNLSPPPSTFSASSLQSPTVLLQLSFTLPSPITLTTSISTPSIASFQQTNFFYAATSQEHPSYQNSCEYWPQFIKKSELTETEKMEHIMNVIFDELEFKSLRAFLLALIPPIPAQNSIKYGNRHKRKLKAFLQGTRP
ncbi:hypothetical protein E1B28_000094 [Marasmius oreades]|uniref:Uncharacterized protein n=1 Tax=Marasmius oreades TaxID=181124 RepID=A0A9P7V0R0_9AGAR|nr:uncharacterized protein E1B28_000094 [Marasmius oreades]KAG7098122.1 hypothetical protein E1B28_000094 [Marasmius oreades]